jgi:MFS family permease
MGLGSRGIDVLQVIILSDLITLREKPFYIGINSIFIAFGAITGPLVGGLCSQYASWRLLGWINIPIAGIVFAMGIFFLHLKYLTSNFRTKLRRID